MEGLGGDRASVGGAPVLTSVVVLVWGLGLGSSCKEITFLRLPASVLRFSAPKACVTCVGCMHLSKGGPVPGCLDSRFVGGMVWVWRAQRGGGVWCWAAAAAPWRGGGVW